MRPSDAKGAAPTPVTGQWVVLHRVGSDHAGPVDSTRSGPDGRFRFRYRPYGAADALYFISSKYQGIAYFSPPLHADSVRGGDADVIVYETTTDTASLRLQGRHFVLSVPRGARRNVAEVFELDNDGTHTVVPRDSTTPTWTTPLPVEAESTTVAPGDIAAGAVIFRRGRLELYAPISPGVRQLAILYALPVKAFPVSQPVGHHVSILEVLLEEPRAIVEGARLREMPAVSIDGRTFRRFLAQDVPANAVIRVTPPRSTEESRGTMRILALLIAVAMFGAAGAWWFVRRRGAPAIASRAAPSDVESLIGELASLDARFERQSAAAGARAEYEARRTELKSRIASALARESERA